MSKSVFVRVLCFLSLDGQSYEPDNLVEFEEPTAKRLKNGGYVDNSDAAIAYAKNELQQTPIKHVPLGVVEEPAEPAA